MEFNGNSSQTWNNRSMEGPLSSDKVLSVDKDYEEDDQNSSNSMMQVPPLEENVVHAEELPLHVVLKPDCQQCLTAI